MPPVIAHFQFQYELDSIRSMLNEKAQRAIGQWTGYVPAESDIGELGRRESI